MEPRGDSPRFAVMLSIGTLTLENPLILAPMAGYTDTCARRLARKLGAGLVVTEMVSAAALTRKTPETLSLLASHPEEEPLAVQLFGSEPAELVEAARIARGHGASLVDINLGCPVRKVCRSGAGAALLLDPPKVARIVESVRRSIDCPLTVKMRLGWDNEHICASEVARLAEQSGADAVTLHPRTRAQGFQGTADWRWVARLKEELRIPVIGSGDITTAAMAAEAVNKGVCDGVMIGRAARGNPWIFSQTLELLAGVPPRPLSPEQRHQGVVEHMEWTFEQYGLKEGVRRTRFLLYHYLRGFPGSARFRSALAGIRDANGLRDLLRDCYLGSGRTQRDRGMEPETPGQGAGREMPAGAEQEAGTGCEPGWREPEGSVATEPRDGDR